MTTPDTIVHLVRHGQVHNPDEILYGRLPRFRLSATGRLQARAAGLRLAEQPIGAIYSSPLLRARQTASEMAASLPGLRVRVTAYLNEVCTPFEGRPGREVDRRAGDVYNHGNPLACYEQPRDIVARAQAFLKRVIRRHRAEQVAAVTHGDVIVFTVLWALERDLSAANKNRLLEAGFAAAYPAPASVTTLTFASPSLATLPALSYWKPGELPALSHNQPGSTTL